MPIQVAADAGGVPVQVRLRGRRLRVAAVEEEWRIVDEWWREREVRRRYFRVTLADGRPLTVFCDLVDGRWYAQRHG